MGAFSRRPGSQGAAVLRLFIAVEPPPPVRAYAAETIRALQGRGDVRWVTEDRLHLTLKFLGDTSREQVSLLSEKLAKTANDFSRFVVVLAGPGAFPNSRRPRTVWLGLERGAMLGRLAEEIDRSVSALGFRREERSFQPHLTLGRVRSPRGLGELAQALAAREALPRAELEWPVTEFQLIRSELRPEGPRYTPLGRFALRQEE